MLIDGCFWHALQHVPVFDNLAVVIQPEDVNPGPIAVAGPFLMTVQNDVIPLGDDAPEVGALAGIFPRHLREVLDEGLLPVGHRRVVLNIDIPNMLLDGLGRLALIEHQVIEGCHGLFVPIKLVCHW